MEANGSIERRQAPVWYTDSAVRDTVEKTATLRQWAPRVVMLVGWVLPLAAAIGGGIANAILVGVVMAVVSTLAARWLDRLVIGPMCRLRHAQAASLLEAGLRVAAPTSALLHRWSSPWPGILAVNADRRLLLAAPSTGYGLLDLAVADVLDVTVQRSTSLETRTKQGARYGIGAGSTPFGMISFGGRTRSVTREIETAVLEVRYRARPVRSNPVSRAFDAGPICTVFIDFGLDRSGADTLRLALLDLCGRAAGSAPSPTSTPETPRA